MSTNHTKSRRRLPAYALIIAINDPPKIVFQARPLRAPELDAIRLRDTLISLGVPHNSIDVLAGQAATRQRIIAKLIEIATSPRIQADAPILIYYAGMSEILVIAFKLNPSRTWDTTDS